MAKRITKKDIEHVKHILEAQIKQAEKLAQEYDEQGEPDWAKQSAGEATGMQFALELLRDIS